MQTGGDQQTVEEGVQTGANSIHASDTLTQSNQSAEHHGPHEQQDGRNHNGDHASHDGHAALAAEEGQEVRQLGVLELVVAQTTDQTGQDADEGVGDLGESHIVGASGIDDTLSIQRQHVGSNGGHHIGVQQAGDHQPRGQSSQTSSAILVISHTNADTDGKQNSHVVDQSATGLDQEETNNLESALNGAALHSIGAESVTDTHQDTADRQSCHGQHQCFAETL